MKQMDTYTAFEEIYIGCAYHIRKCLTLGIIIDWMIVLILTNKNILKTTCISMWIQSIKN